MMPVIDPPKSVEAEEATLGGILINPASLIEVSGILRSHKDFWMVRHQIIYSAMLKVRERGEPLDAITIADCLEQSGDLSEIGGRSYLVYLANNTETSIYASVYAELVRRTAIRRDMLTAQDKMTRAILDGDLSIEEVRATADSLWLEATSDVSRNEAVWMKDVLGELFDDISRAMAKKDVPGVISTGYRDLDQLMFGFEPETLTVVAGRPGMGKSAIMDNFALNIARRGNTVFYATSERSRKMVTRRMLSTASDIHLSLIKTGRMTQSQTGHLFEVFNSLNLPIVFDDSPMPTPAEIFNQARWAIQRYGANIILFDGMYRAKTGVSQIDNGNNNHQKYGQIALDLKTMARELKVPVVTTHQLSRALEQRSDKRPIMSDLRESGRIEEEADKIMFLYRDEVYNETTELPNQADVIVAKHRDGATGVASLYFDKKRMKFSDASINRVDLSDMG